MLATGILCIVGGILTVCFGPIYLVIATALPPLMGAVLKSLSGSYCWAWAVIAITVIKMNVNAIFTTKTRILIIIAIFPQKSKVSVSD